MVEIARAVVRRLMRNTTANAITSRPRTYATSRNNGRRASDPPKAWTTAASPS